MSIIVTGIIAISASIGGGLFYLGHKSQNMKDQATLSHNLLGVCGEKPNCVTSFPTKSKEHYLAPLKMEKIDFKGIKIPSNCKLEKEKPNYQHYLCKSSFFGFVDDLELLYVPSEKLLYGRSQSRVGHSDMGANRKRLEKVFSQYE